MTTPSSHTPETPPKGWNLAPPEVIPKPSVYPAMLSLGAALLVWGLISSLILTAAGAVLFVYALVGWIGEIRHERKG
jgi:hypothetical protein